MAPTHCSAAPGGGFGCDFRPTDLLVHRGSGARPSGSLVEHIAEAPFDSDVQESAFRVSDPAPPSNTGRELFDAPPSRRFEENAKVRGITFLSRARASSHRDASVLIPFDQTHNPGHGGSSSNPLRIPDGTKAKRPAPSSILRAQENWRMVRAQIRNDSGLGLCHDRGQPHPFAPL